MDRRKGTPAKGRVTAFEWPRCPAIKPWEFVSEEQSDADRRAAARMAAQLLRCRLEHGHAGPHEIQHGENVAHWREEPAIYFTTVPGRIYT